MTMDEMVTEILRLYEAMRGEPSREMVQVYVSNSGASARIAGREATAVTLDRSSAFDAVAALRDKLRAEAAVSASEHEAKASALRAALGECDPSQALDDARGAWREYVAARDALMASRRGEGADVHTAEERLRCAGDAMADLLGGGQ